MASQEGAGSPPNVDVTDALQRDTSTRRDSDVDTAQQGPVVGDLSEDNNSTLHDRLPVRDESESDDNPGLDDHNQSPTNTCPYRNEELWQDECVRFWDCPSHQVPRQLDNENTNDTAEGVDEQQLPSDTPVRGDASSDTSDIPQAEGSSEAATSQVETTTEQDTAEDVASSKDHPELATSESGIPVAEPEAESGDRSNPNTDGAAAVRSTSPDRDQSALDSDAMGDHRGSVGQDTSRRNSHSAPGSGLVGHSSTVPGTQPSAVDTPPSFFSTIASQQENRRPRGEFTIPTWQPDSDVTSCPICHADFGLFNRRHHCRKCGRVVCNNCSPHRIVIPHQYIVRPPDETSTAAMTGLHGIERGLADFDVSLGGGRSVRLCNPCVPDPNTTPPPQYTSPTTHHDPFQLPRTGHQRSQSSAASMSSSVGVGYGDRGGLPSRAVLLPPTQQRQTSSPFSRSRSATVNHLPSQGGNSSTLQDSAYRPLLSPLGHRYPRSARAGHFDRQTLEASQFPGASPSSTGRLVFGSQNSNASSSANAGNVHRPLPPPPRIPEEDQCPICHQELPSRILPEFERLREEHITACITEHSTSRPEPPTPGQAGAPGTSPARALRPTGMISYLATEKDNANGDECGICFDEYETGVKMARLECWCRFHYNCIVEWFERKGVGRCPVHQHDDYGY